VVSCCDSSCEHDVVVAEKIAKMVNEYVIVARNATVSSSILLVK